MPTKHEDLSLSLNTPHPTHKPTMRMPTCDLRTVEVETDRSLVSHPRLLGKSQVSQNKPVNTWETKPPWFASSPYMLRQFHPKPTLPPPQHKFTQNFQRLIEKHIAPSMYTSRITITILESQA